MKIINNIFEYLCDNKDWIFSGVGVTVIICAFSYAKNCIKNKKESIKTLTTENQNIPEISNTINTFEIDKTPDNTSINHPLNQLINRFVEIYTSHNLEIHEIPSILGKEFNLKMSDFKSHDSILEVLDERIINKTCSTFGINIQWLHGKQRNIYTYRDYYKQITTFIDLLCNLYATYQDHLEIYFLKNGKLNKKVWGKNYVLIILKYPIAQVNSNNIYSYIPISTMWDWGYWKTRYQLKSIIWVCEKLDICFNHGYDIDIDSMTKLSAGLIFPEKVLNRIPVGYTWYAEDYVDWPSQNVQAKETDETELVHKYISEQGYTVVYKKALSKYKISI